MHVMHSCPKCGFVYAWNGRNCGHCQPFPKPIRGKEILLVLSGLAIIAGGLMWWPSHTENNVNPLDEAKTELPAAPATAATPENFLRVRVGMRRDDVRHILGPQSVFEGYSGDAWWRDDFDIGVSYERAGKGNVYRAYQGYLKFKSGKILELQKQQ